MSEPGLLRYRSDPAGQTVLVAALGVGLFAISLATAQAASSPFGVGLPEPSAMPGGWFAGFFAWIARNQATFIVL
ncbi:hypothetical protein [Breoghania sp.]|uniref:hypothetical protein n=1 Tax=Breoghania sp. TaxID=2065378 RepID=UPI00260E8C07|nr:hypothetical protein [Breoghania sp.]MDJ0930433.1 hypothetical protein [Breoghania sp.]